MCVNDKEEIVTRALREYQRQYDEIKQMYAEKPLHNWTSHIADAIRYLAINYRRLFAVNQGVIKREGGF